MKEIYQQTVEEVLERVNGKKSGLTMQFTASSGRHSVLERPFSETNGRPFFS